MSKKGVTMRILWLIVGFLLAASLVIWTDKCSAEDYIGLGGSWHNGHSWSGQNKIDPAGSNNWGANLYLEKGVDRGQRLDFTYLLRTDLLRFTKRDNSSGGSDRIYNAIVGIEGRTYLRSGWRVDPYVGLEVAYGVAGDGRSAACGVAYGIEYSVTDSFALSFDGRNLADSDRRHDLYGISAKFRF